MRPLMPAFRADFARATNKGQHILVNGRAIKVERDVRRLSRAEKLDGRINDGVG